jgi:uncharacterized phage protein (TIGR01671 family)
MERKIKFRVWDGQQIIFPDYITNGGIAYWKENSIPECSKDTVMQFTGLLDKDGEEIYEGDIIRILDNFKGRHQISKVIFEHGRFKATPFYMNHYDYPSDFLEGLNECEVIGNIYKNPELLK